jgi:hypothetical protein
MEGLGACALGKENFGGMRANVPPVAVQTQARSTKRSAAARNVAAAAALPKCDTGAGGCANELTVSSLGRPRDATLNGSGRKRLALLFQTHAAAANALGDLVLADAHGRRGKEDFRLRRVMLTYRMAMKAFDSAADTRLGLLQAPNVRHERQTPAPRWQPKCLSEPRRWLSARWKGWAPAPRAEKTSVACARMYRP